ncbi:TPA: helix-turn-helix domain-containing protein [Aeromonas veronii]|uniref:winged helix-turn-helix domain-containing protein n=1 Tax=Aeromonas veronii TaxID=654 RepID=UPI0033112A8F|nr:helix-turn-helix domain-containing protein [Aeromonas veronii]HDO1336361.1 helix-turn-helix domain-containing protein [Aeromonas veronii]HDO1340894.1 helix-turn-helix domain-containing protein [Aeromonas veronii]HDO1345417.1 helix-turn-helix domain-containing protein [Aeromonas veronii]HDO1349983.1 helix-turn-helix domain-containing protein [Aeromonas veronii]
MDKNKKLIIGGYRMLDYNSVSGDVTWNSKVIARLSKSETLIFTTLLNQINQFCSKDDLIEKGWPNKFVSPNSLAVAIKNIRKVLQETDSVFTIETVHRRGYILHGDASKVQSHITDTQFSCDSPPPLYEMGEGHKIPETSLDEGVAHIDSEKYNIVLRKSSIFYINFRKVIISVYCLAVVSLSIMYFLSSGELYCYQLHEKTKVCGVFELNKSKQSLISNEIKKQTGLFLYGYDNDDQDIKIYSVD